MMLIFQTLQKYGSKDMNRCRNRYHNILPYDFNRVKLLTGDNDYINASYVSGYKSDEEYIISQGPTAETVDDHWQMILEHNIKEVIQLTPFFDNFQVLKVNFWTKFLTVLLRINVLITGLKMKMNSRKLKNILSKQFRKQVILRLILYSIFV